MVQGVSRAVEGSWIRPIWERLLFARGGVRQRLALSLSARKFPVSRQVRPFVALRNEDLPIVENDRGSHFHVGFAGKLTGRDRRHELNPSRLLVCTGRTGSSSRMKSRYNLNRCVELLIDSRRLNR